MLRRYLIVNGVTTVLLYGALFAIIPSAPHVMQSAQATFENYFMESPMLGPLVHRIVVLSSN